MSDFKMTTTEIRDELLRQRTLYLQAVEASKQRAETIKEILAKFDSERIQALSNLGIDVREIVSFDVTRAQEDSNYAAECNERLKLCIDKLHSYLEESLHV